MENTQKRSPKSLTPLDILRTRCPKCRKGAVMQGKFTIRKKCDVCGHDFYPEPGYYLGAMMMSFIATAVLTIPLIIGLKLSGADVSVLVIAPFIEFAIVGPILLYYARIIWLYAEYSMTTRLGDRR